jgi:hypothetical protein
LDQLYDTHSSESKETGQTTAHQGSDITDAGA